MSKTPFQNTETYAYVSGSYNQDLLTVEDYSNCNPYPTSNLIERLERLQRIVLEQARKIENLESKLNNNENK